LHLARRRDLDQVIIDLQEPRDRGQRVTQLLQSRRNRWLDLVLQVLVIVEPARLNLEQPPQVEQSRVPGGQLTAGREQRVEQPSALDPVVALVVVPPEPDDHVLRGLRHPRPVRLIAVPPRCLRVQQRLWQPERQLPRPPVRRVQVGVEVLLQQLPGSPRKFPNEYSLVNRVAEISARIDSDRSRRCCSAVSGLSSARNS
jgi:hypothetical protein